jgi:regulator of protease activity HflC (stomatin/prohibitin superfamily)
MDSSQTVPFVFYGIIALIALGAILSGFFQVETAEAVVVQRMGKFQRVATAGMNFN